jgi:hypothetical protein
VVYIVPVFDEGTADMLEGMRTDLPDPSDTLRPWICRRLIYGRTSSGSFDDDLPLVHQDFILERTTRLQFLLFTTLVDPCEPIVGWWVTISDWPGSRKL